MTYSGEIYTPPSPPPRDSSLQGNFNTSPVANTVWSRHIMNSWGLCNCNKLHASQMGKRELGKGQRFIVSKLGYHFVMPSCQLSRPWCLAYPSYAVQSTSSESTIPQAQPNGDRDFKGYTDAEKCLVVPSRDLGQVGVELGGKYGRAILFGRSIADMHGR